MSNKNEVFEYLIGQLRQQLPVVDVMGEIKRWSIDRSIVGRGIYTDEENAVIDTYIGMEHNPYKQQCEDLAHEVQSLKNQLRDASAQIKELHMALAKATGDVEAYKLIRKGAYGSEQSGCRKEDTQECEHEWRVVQYSAGVETDKCRLCGQEKEVRYGQSGCRKEDAQECEHDWYFYDTSASMMCKKCGLKK